MPPKAEKKPTTAGKAPAGKAPATKKEAGKKTAAVAGEKKKRSKTRKETYSSYIYKGMFTAPDLCLCFYLFVVVVDVCFGYFADDVFLSCREAIDLFTSCHLSFITS
jgi:hypothetical protein